MDINPEFQRLIPPPSGEELARLEASLLEEGCREPLIAWACGLDGANAVLVDGHNRLAICEKHEIGYRLSYRKFGDGNAAKLWIVNNQLARRNLGDFAKGELALRGKAIIADIAKENQRLKAQQEIGEEGLTNWSNLDNGTMNTRGKLAEIAGVGQGTIQRIEKILEKGTEDLIALARAGALSINAAYQIAQTKPEAQRGLIKGVRQGAAPPQIPRASGHLPEDDGNGRQKSYSEVNFEQMQLDFEIVILRFGTAQPVAADMATALLAVFRRQNQGTSVYFSVATAKEHQEKKAKFRAEFNGKNRTELCKKYDISKRTSFRWLLEFV